MAAFGGPEIVSSNLVMCLDAANRKSYPGTGTVWSDVSGNNKNCVLVNGPTYSSDNMGSLTFDGANDYAVTVGTDSTNLSNGITMIQILKYTASSTTVSLSKGLKVAGHYEIWHQGTQLNCYFHDLGTGTYQNSGYSINDGKWKHVAITYNNSNVVFYVDGAIVKSNAIAGSIGSLTSTIDIGRSEQDGFYFNGSIAVSQVYNRALSAAEIRQNFFALRGRYGI